jgi:hypothetical protein
MALFRFLHRGMTSVSVGLAAVGLLAACAGVPPAQPAAEMVKARAQERWDALVKGDVPKAYAFLSPGSRAVTDLESYRESIKRGFWKSAQVTGAECSSDEACEVTAEIEYAYRGSRVKSPLKETWVRQEKDWWYVLK